ncbi:MAG: glycerol-3-phosphate 1-O-acyltransferase PlsY [Candidatus Pacebacteria bacterium]|nr:glycerol-3-phosphate 1-O-acyltransferase PlsY [Candidatus Paceibacterota bacterium]
MNIYLLILISYLLGSIPFGYIAGKINKIDIKKIGSGSTGATNVSRALGVRWAVLVAILDVLKAALPVYLASNYLTIEWQIALVSIIPVLGHIFPIWLKFKGGKGIATFVPALIAFCGLKEFIILITIWAILLKITKTMSLNNLVLGFFIPFIIWLHSHSITYFILGVVFYLIILWSHRENIKRLYCEKELKL